ILHDFGQRLAAAHVVERENLEDEILGGDVGPAFPSYHDLYGLGHAHAHVFGDPGIEYVGGADAESHASDSAHVRSMRVGANVELPGEGVAFQHDGVADALAALAVAQLAVQADSLLFGEVLLLELQLRGQVEQAHPALLLRDHVVQEGEMVAEEQDGGGIVDLGVLAHEVLEKDGGHGGDVLVAEAEVGGCKPCISRLDEEASGSWRLAIGCRRSAVCQILCGRGRPRPRNSHTTVSAVRQLATGDCTMCFAKIFSARVIGRGGVVMGGTKALPCMRATLNGKRPPYSITWRVISSSPWVNSLSGISSPRRMRWRRPKLVEVSTPKFWQFCL